MLKANIGFVSEKRITQSESGQKKTTFKVKRFDKTGIITAILTGKKHCATFKTAKAILMTNILLKGHCLIITLGTRIFHASPEVVPDEILKSAMVDDAPPSTITSIKTSIRSPQKSRVSIKGKIIKV